MPKVTAEMLERATAAVPDRLLSVLEVSALLGCSDRSTWKLCYGGRLPRPVRVGRSVRWRASDIAAFIRLGCNIDAFDAETRKAVAAVR